MAGKFGSTSSAKAQQKAVEKMLRDLSAEVEGVVENLKTRVIGNFEVVEANSEQLRELHAKMIEAQKQYNQLQAAIEAGELGGAGAPSSGAKSGVAVIDQILNSEDLKRWRSSKLAQAKVAGVNLQKGTVIKGRPRRRAKAPDNSFSNVTNPGIVKPWYKPEIVDLAQPMVRVFDLFPRVPVDSNTVEYDKETAEYPWVADLASDILATATSIPLSTVIGLGTAAPYNTITLDDGTNSETLTISAIDAATKTVTTNATTNAYAAADTRVSAAYFQCTAEGELKPRAAHKVEPIQKNVCTMAVWEDTSVQVLMDDTRLERFLRLKLMDIVERNAEKAIFYGDGVGSNIEGIWTDPDVPQALWSGGVAGSSREDHMLRQAFAVIKQSYRPTDVLIAPDDLLEMFISKDNEGAYLFVRDLSQDIPSNFFGLRITWSNQLRDKVGGNVGGDFLVGDFEAAAVILDREDMSLQIGTKDDDFVRNRRTVLAEMRFAFCIERPLALVRGTFDSQP